MWGVNDNLQPPFCTIRLHYRYMKGLSNTLYYVVTLLMLALTVASCKNTSGSAPQGEVMDDFEIIKQSDTLRVITLSSSTSYFMYRGEDRGYEYELIRRFADDNDLEIKLIIADNYTQMLQKLHDGEGDVVAYDVPVTIGDDDMILHCGPVKESYQVIVQRRGDVLTDVIDLVDKDVYVENGSKYETRMNNLNEEIGGGINVKCVELDTVVVEDLIEMVSRGEISYTVADKYIALLNRTYYSNLDINLAVSFPQRSQWAVRKDSPALAVALNEWAALNSTDVEIKALSKRYFEESKTAVQSSIMSVEDGRISPYDEIFKLEASRIGWDWRLLAAIAYHESRFDPTVVSWAGARGIMQLMPATAAAFGLGIDSIADTPHNVHAAVESLRAVERTVKNLVGNPDEQIKFVIAAYNSGLGHLIDGIKLAKKYGKNPQVWYGEVEEAMMMKTNPEYYNDEVCSFGYFRGSQTKAYVRNVMSLYEYYCDRIQQ